MLDFLESQGSLEEFLKRHVKPYDPAAAGYDRPPFVADLRESKHEPIYNAHSYHTKVPPRGIIPYILHYTKPGDLILDPFCGSGMTGAATQMCSAPPEDILQQFPELKDRVGSRACILNDLSPAACHIAYNFNMPVNVEALRHEFENVKVAVKEEFEWLYGTEHYEPACGLYDLANPEVISRVKNPPARCAPGTLLGDEERTWELLTKAEIEVRLGFSVTELPRHESWGQTDVAKVENWICIPAIIDYTIWSDVFKCQGFITIEEPTHKVSQRGVNKGKPILKKKKVSRGCGQTMSLWDCAMDHDTGEVKEYFRCPQCGQEWKKSQIQLTGSLPVFSCYSYAGLKQSSKKTTISSLWCERKTTSQEQWRISEIQAKTIPYWYPTDNLPMGRQTRKTMSGRGIHRVDEFYTKRNLWALARLWKEFESISQPEVATRLKFAFTGVSDGLSKRCRYLKNASFPMPVMSGTLYVPSFQKECNVLYAIARKVDVRIPKMEAAIPRSKSYEFMLFVGSATSLKLPDNCVDYIFSDPPFGEALQYAELNFLWESWLRQFSDLSKDCVINYVHKKDLAFYATTISAAFREMFRVLKPGRWASIVFKNTDDRVWEVIKSGVSSCGFDVVTAQELDKQQRTFNQVNRAKAAGTDVVMNLFKPSIGKTNRMANGEDASHNKLWDIIQSYLSELPGRIKTDPKTYSDLSRTTPVLHSVVIKGLLSQNIPIEGTTPDEVEKVCARYCRKVESKWFLRGEQLSHSGDSQMLIEAVEIQDEKTAISWLRHQLQQRPMTEGELNTAWKMATLRVSLEKPIIEILTENFWQDLESKRWREPTEEERQMMNDSQTLRVLHDAERFLAGSLKRQVSDTDLCEWIEAIFRACRAVEEQEGEDLPALRDFAPVVGYRMISQLFHGVLSDHVPVAVFGRVEKQARVAASRLQEGIEPDNTGKKSRESKDQLELEL